MAFYYDYKYPFSSKKTFSEYLIKNYDIENTALVVYRDLEFLEVSYYLDKNLYYPQSKIFAKIINFDDRVYEISGEEIFSDASRLVDEYDNVMVILDNDEIIDPETLELFSFKKVDSKSYISITKDEKYYIYLFSPD